MQSVIAKPWRVSAVMFVAPALLFGAVAAFFPLTQIDRRSMDTKFHEWVVDRAPKDVHVLDTWCETESGRGGCNMRVSYIENGVEDRRAELWCRVYTHDDGSIHGQCPEVPWLPTI